MTGSLGLQLTVTDDIVSQVGVEVFRKEIKQNSTRIGLKLKLLLYNDDPFLMEELKKKKGLGNGEGIWRAHQKEI